MAQSKAVATQTPRKPSVPTKKLKMGFNHIPIYKGEEDPKCHWFICEIFWDATNIIVRISKWCNSELQCATVP